MVLQILGASITHHENWFHILKLPGKIEAGPCANEIMTGWWLMWMVLTRCHPLQLWNQSWGTGASKEYLPAFSPSASSIRDTIFDQWTSESWFETELVVSVSVPFGVNLTQLPFPIPSWYTDARVIIWDQARAQHINETTDAITANIPMPTQDNEAEFRKALSDWRDSAAAVQGSQKMSWRSKENVQRFDLFISEEDMMASKGVKDKVGRLRVSRHAKWDDDRVD